MKKLKYGKSNAKSFFSGKGFYTALALSLVAVGCATWIGVSSTMNKLKQDPTENLENTTASKVPEEGNEWEVKTEDVNKPQSDVTQTNAKEEQEEQLFIAPLAGKSLNPFSGEEVVKSKTLDEWRTHTGVDIAAKIGTPVKAISSGTVTEVTSDPMWG
ncbi:MAG: M23 family metallopeptidase, partial [Oscillospiraceae bacterium]